MNYQVCDPLTQEEYEALKASIAKTGVEVPVVFDEHGDILDGHHRMRAYYELKAAGVDVPPPAKDIRRGLSEAEKRNLARTLNAVRRQMSKEQRNKLIVAMREDGMSYRQIGEAVGVDAKTAHNVVTRATVENSTVDLPATITGRDGKERPATMPRFVTPDVDLGTISPRTGSPHRGETYTNGMPVLDLPGSPEPEIAFVPAEPPEEPALPLAAANHAISSDPDYDGDEWYTPLDFIVAARCVLGDIDFDPASSAEAQTVVQATRYATKEDDSLRPEYPWSGRVWMNPPYSMPLIRQFVGRLIDEYDAGNVSEAIVLTNNSSDTQWFHSLLSRFPACFTRGRIYFWRKEPNNNFATRQGQTLFYLGPNRDAFAREFAAIGLIVECTNAQSDQ